MIDTFSLLLSHGLIALACWRLLARPDLDRDIPPPAPRPGRADRAGAGFATDRDGADSNDA